MNYSVETRSGNNIDLLDPNPGDIEIKDIAWSLSHIPRFGGHTINQSCLNVAEHSLFVARLVANFDKVLNFFEFDAVTLFDRKKQLNHYFTTLDKADLTIAALLHDGHEAYFGDIISPVKNLPHVRSALKPYIVKMDSCIHQKFLGRDEILDIAKDIIKTCDLLAQAVESRVHLKSRGANFELGFQSISDNLYYMSPKCTGPSTAYRTFLNKFNHLSSLRSK